MNIKTLFEFGDEVEDKIGGFRGVVASYVCHVTGCAQYLVIPKTKEGDDYKSGQYFDEARLRLVKSKAVSMVDVKDEKKPGGPREMPSAR